MVRASFGELRACYESLLQTNPAASDSIALDFEVAPDGHVSQATVNAESPVLESMEGCAQESTEALVFPAAAGKTTVTYPVMFSTG